MTPKLGTLAIFMALMATTICAQSPEIDTQSTPSSEDIFAETAKDIVVPAPVDHIFSDPTNQIVPTTGKPDSLTPAPKYVIPDLSPNLKELLSVKRPYFTMTPTYIAVVDYTSFSQNSNNVLQVGDLDPAWETRSNRLLFRGRIGESENIRYLFALSYNGLNDNPNPTWSIFDCAIAVPITSSGRTLLGIGKTKEPFSYELIGDSANLPHQERILNPFFQSRNVGVQVSHYTEDKNSTFRGGIFNDSAFETGEFDASDTQLSGRVTSLIWDDPECNRFLHLGLAGRLVGPEGDSLRYRAKPESNVASNFVDTGTISADGALHCGLEALWNRGPFSLLAEYNQAWVDAPADGNPDFNGWYFTGSWILTGETRPYDRTVGFARRVIPQGKWGAPELVVRFAQVDLNDAVVNGGEMDRLSLGLNWWASRQWKFGITWGRTWLDRNGIDGTENSILARMQWAY